MCGVNYVCLVQLVTGDQSRPRKMGNLNLAPTLNSEISPRLLDLRSPDFMSKISQPGVIPQLVNASVRIQDKLVT